MFSNRTSEGVSNASATILEIEIRKWSVEMRQYFNAEDQLSEAELRPLKYSMLTKLTSIFVENQEQF